MNEELEEYRKGALMIVRKNAGFLRSTAGDVLSMPVKAVYVVGSVLEPRRFTEASDIDVAVVVEGPEGDTGLSEPLSEKLQNEMIRWPLGDVGVVNTLVFVNKLQLVRGKAQRVDV
jgi:predicted nucleotidyltransferase